MEDVETLKKEIEHLTKKIKMLKTFIHINYDRAIEYTDSTTNTLVDTMLGALHASNEDCMSFRNHYETMDRDAQAARMSAIINRATRRTLKEIGEL
jgi:ectoine hydroxylase-related dioxygenase (phytanoyl-CoA dioxygenase family)